MTTVTVMEQVSEARERRELDRQRSWATLLRDALGGDFDPDHILGRLESLGRSEADLAEAIDRHQRREEARRQLVEVLPAQRRQLIEVRQQIGAANVELEQARRRHQETVSPLLSQQAELSAAIATEAELRRVLLATAPEGLLDELHRAEQRAQAAHTRVGPLRRSVEDLRRQVRDDERRLAYSREYTILAESDRGVKAQESGLDKAKARLEQGERELAEAREAEAAAREAVEVMTRRATET